MAKQNEGGKYSSSLVPHPDLLETPLCVQIKVRIELELLAANRFELGLIKD